MDLSAVRRARGRERVGRGDRGGAAADAGARQRVDPDLRFHYRYRAADLAAGGALMPDNTLEKAEVLCEAGRG